MLTSKQETLFFITLGCILAAFLSIGYIFGYKIPRERIQPEEIVEKVDPFKNIFTTARSVFVYDIASDKILYEKNAYERLPLASVTKVMSALTADELLGKNAEVVITLEALLTEGDSGLLNAERWRVEDLINLSLVGSSNDAMHALALTAGRDKFIARMNALAGEIGLANTYYLNETGLDMRSSLAGVEHGGAYGSARDQAVLFAHILQTKPSLLSATRESVITLTSLSNILHRIENTNKYGGQIPGLMASKTGFTDLAGGNLVIAFDPEIGHPIVIAVLGSTTEARFTDVTALVWASLESIKDSEIIKK